MGSTVTLNACKTAYKKDKICQQCQYKKKVSDQHLHVIFRKVVILLTIIRIIPMKTKRSSLYLQQKTRSGAYKQGHNFLVHKISYTKNFLHIYITKIMLRSGWGYNFLIIITKQNTIQSSSTFFQRCARTPNTRPITRWRKELQVYQEVILILYIIEYFYTYA